MGLQPVKTETSGGIPVWVNVYEVAVGGFTLVTTALEIGSVLPAGTPVLVNEIARTATVSKTARVNDAATAVATDIKVDKGHPLKVGEYAAAVVGGKAYAITAIDTSNASYDTITVGTTLGVVLAAGDCIFVSSATGATAAAIEVLPNALTHFEEKVETFKGVSVVLRGTVKERRMPALIAGLKVNLKGILFNTAY